MSPQMPRIALALFALIAGVLLSASVAQAGDVRKSRTWLKESAKRECADMQKAVRDYYAGGYTGDDIAVSYCNKGGYVVTKVKLVVTRASDNVKVFKKTRKQNLTRDWGHVFLVNGPGFASAGETFKMKLEYTIASTGILGKHDTRKCSKSFTFNPNKDVLWMVRSEGTKDNNNGCKQVTFKRR